MHAYLSIAIDFSDSATTVTIRRTFDQLLEELEEEEQSPLLVTIWLGANDATIGFVAVPLDSFITNLRRFIDQLLRHPNLKTTKIVLMTPPPINASMLVSLETKDEEARQQMLTVIKTGIAWRVWVRKMEYSSACMKLAAEYGKQGENRVVGLDVFRAMVNYGLQSEGKEIIPYNEPLTEDLAEEKLIPGCSLPGAKLLPDGTFSDGLHLDAEVRMSDVNIDTRLIDLGIHSHQ
jgi:hypothetical protein